MKAASTAAGTGVAALTGKGQRTKRRVDTDKTSNIQYFRTDNKSHRAVFAINRGLCELALCYTFTDANHASKCVPKKEGVERLGDQNHHIKHVLRY